eukprot:g36956.t1
MDTPSDSNFDDYYDEVAQDLFSEEMETSSLLPVGSSNVLQLTIIVRKAIVKVICWDVHCVEFFLENAVTASRAFFCLTCGLVQLGPAAPGFILRFLPIQNESAFRTLFRSFRDRLRAWKLAILLPQLRIELHKLLTKLSLVESLIIKLALKSPLIQVCL